MRFNILKIKTIIKLYLRPNGKVDLFSRNGKELTNFRHIQDQIAKSINKNPITSALVLDGEVVSTNFQELMRQIHRKISSQNKDATLFLFDILSFENFKFGVEKLSYTKRNENLNNWYKRNFEFLHNVKLINRKLVDLDTNEGKKIYKNFNNKSITEGYEGIMIKDPESFYECKRSSTWLKLKPIIEISLQVINYEEGSGRNKGKLGALIAEGEDDGKFFKLNIGSGFTDQQRESFWKNKEQLIGKIVEVKAESISKSQDGDFWSLRFPRFKCFRGFNDKEKL